MTRAGTTAAILVTALAVSACGGDGPKKKKEVETGGFDVRRLLGVQQTAPDEFAVISKRPLEMPKDFAALPPPDPDARSTRTPDALSEARQALLREDGTPNAASTRTSASEAALLNAAGTSDPNIRTTLAAEQAVYEDEQDSYFLDDVIPGLREYRGADDKNTIKPFEEYKRLNPRSREARPLRRARPGSPPFPAPRQHPYPRRPPHPCGLRRHPSRPAQRRHSRRSAPRRPRMAN